MSQAHVQTLKIMNPTEIRDFREENNHESGIWWIFWHVTG